MRYHVEGAGVQAVKNDGKGNFAIRTQDGTTLDDAVTAYKENKVETQNQPKTLDDAVKACEGGKKYSLRENLTDEEREITDRAKKDGTYMKAPNGKDTNLTEKQWAQVRTKAFKDWFGDWEKAARIAKLRESEPIEITGKEYQGKYDLTRDSAKNWIKTNPGTDREIGVHHRDAQRERKRQV